MGRKMINKKEQEREMRRFGGVNRMYNPRQTFALIFAIASFFGRFFNFFHRKTEPFELPKAAPSFSGRFEGYTFKRIKKVGNFFAYGWVCHDTRIKNLNPIGWAK